MRLQSVNIDSMKTSEAFLHIVEFLFIFTFSFVNFFTQKFVLQCQFLPFLCVVLKCVFQFLLQVADLRVFDLDKFTQSIKFCMEALVLLTHILFQVAQLCIEKLFKLSAQLVDFFVLFMDHVEEVFSVLAHYLLQTLNLRFFFLPSPFLLFKRGIVDMTAFLELLVHPSKLKLILLFRFIEISLHACQLLLQTLSCTCLRLGCRQTSFFLCLHSSFLPHCDFSQQIFPLAVALHIAVSLLAQEQGEFLILGAQIKELFILSHCIFLHRCLLPEEQVVLYLEILCPSQPQPGTIELITDGQQVLLQSLRFPSVEVSIIARR